MRKYQITVDCGTSNTRAFLWREGRLLAAEKRAVGVRNTAIDGHNGRLKAAVRECLEALLTSQSLDYADVEGIFASGMITSNVGLAEIPHLAAPVSAEDLAAGMRAVVLPDVCPLPIHFIPGVKNSAAPVTADSFEAMDIMRGEETETVALLQRLDAPGGWLIVLPGSHTKFVSVDRDARIAGCLTSITGELLAAITRETLIADAVQRRFVTEETYDREMLRTGCETAARVGLGRACFSARILAQFAGEPPERLANYILGACLQSDVAAIRNSAALRVAPDMGALVAGGGVTGRAMADVLAHAGLFARVQRFEPGDDLPLSGLGALAIAARARDGSILRD